MSGLTAARLIEIEFGENDRVTEKSGGVQIDVQFNPETLKLTYANQIAQPQGGDQAAGTSGRQYVGSGTTKLALALWFDATALEGDRIDDVRRLTQKVVHFITPARVEGAEGRMLPPGLRFSWGTFLFDGIVEGLEESLEFFSPEGKPLRAQVSLTVSRQKILSANLGEGGRSGGPGLRPLSPARAGLSLQAMVATTAGSPPWQDIARANGIEDPLRLAPGRLVDLGARVGVRVSVGRGG